MKMPRRPTLEHLNECYSLFQGGGVIGCSCVFCSGKMNIDKKVYSVKDFLEFLGERRGNG